MKTEIDKSLEVTYEKRYNFQLKSKLNYQHKAVSFSIRNDRKTLLFQAKNQTTNPSLSKLYYSGQFHVISIINRYKILYLSQFK